MSTRGCVAVGTKRTWQGVYNHADSYPGGLGEEVYRIAREHFQQGRLEDLRTTILQSSRWEDIAHPDGRRLRESHSRVTSAKPDPLHIEWVYVIDVSRACLHVLASKEAPGGSFGVRSRVGGPVKLPGGIWDYGHCRYRQQSPCSLPFATDARPDWLMISNFVNDPESWDPARIYLPAPMDPRRSAFARIMDDDLV